MGIASRRILRTTSTRGTSIFEDFSAYTDSQLITDATTYSFASFPHGGTLGPANPSALWEMDTGKLIAQNGWGYSDTPNEFPDRYFNRLNTRNFDLKNICVSWKYKATAFGSEGYSVASSYAVDLWLRYQT